MSCEFCNKFDFTSVAVKENNIHSAGGSSRFTDAAYDNRPEFQLFQFCPICGCSILYEKPSANRVPAHSPAPVRVAVDCYGQRIPFAIEDDDLVLSEEEYRTINQLKADTGCGFQMCKDAYRYAESYGGNYGMMIAYCKAKVYGVKTDIPFHTRVKSFMEDMQ